MTSFAATSHMSEHPAVPVLVPPSNARLASAAESTFDAVQALVAPAAITSDALPQSLNGKPAASERVLPSAPAFVPPSADQLGHSLDLAWLSEQSRLLESAHPREIIAWAVKHYAPHLTMATAFGPEGCLIIHWLAQIDPTTHVFNLETGYQFQETLELRDRIAARYGLEVELRQPELTVLEYETLHGGPLYKSNPDQCCHDRKILVLQKAAAGHRAWMSGIRRDQSSDRGVAPIVGWDKKFNLVKISPLANWTKQQVWKVIMEEDVPYNPLHDQGFTSIGCWPCTRAVGFGEDERAGRWSGSAKTECGLHTRD